MKGSESLPVVASSNVAPKKCSKLRLIGLTIAVITVLYFDVSGTLRKYFGSGGTPLDRANLDDLCPQAGRLFPSESHDLWSNLSAEVASPDFRSQAIEWLSGAVRVP